jgi:hypothetical protein
LMFGPKLSIGDLGLPQIPAETEFLTDISVR